MCSIAGFLALGEEPVDPERAAVLIHALLASGRERGRDGAGMAVVTRSGALRCLRSLELPTVHAIRSALGPDASVVLANNRAEPTTEHLERRSADALQPYSADHWSCVHNGTVANDRELAAALGVHVGIDSAVIPWALDRLGPGRALRALRGSFALAAVDLRQPRRLLLARDYKPLCVSRDRAAGLLLFASRPSQFAPRGGLDGLCDRPASLAPWSWTQIDGQTLGVETTPVEPLSAARKALVVASGGLDSTVAAAMVAREGTPITLVHFRYGCRAEDSERRAVQNIGRVLACPVREIDLGWLGRLGASALTVPGRSIASCESGAEFPHEWVPARNMAMIAAACAMADAEGFTDIVLGTNLEEGGTYADNTEEFMETMGAAAALGTQVRPRVRSPLGMMMKHEIVATALRIGAPIDLTWSCYQGGDVQCGECGPCFMRRAAFHANGALDPIAYRVPFRRERPVVPVAARA